MHYDLIHTYSSEKLYMFMYFCYFIILHFTAIPSPRSSAQEPRVSSAGKRISSAGSKKSDESSRASSSLSKDEMKTPPHVS